MDQTIHAVVLILYLLVMLAIGIYFFRLNKSQTDYYLGGRTLNIGSPPERPGFGHERLVDDGASRNSISAD